MTLDEKIVLITGGTGQLGHVVAETFAKWGVHVASSYLFEDELRYLSGFFKKTVFVTRADVTNEQEVGATSAKDFGKMMTLAMKLLRGKTDGKAVQDTVRKVLEVN